MVALCAALLVVNGQPANAAGTGTLSKTGKDLTTGSTTAVNGGDTVQYVLGATNTTSATAQMQVTDVLQQGQLVQHGSVTAPPGYQAAYSTDGGATYQNTEPASGVNAIRASGSAVPGSKGAAVPLPTPVGTISTNATKGDGYQAIFYNGRIYNVHHHRDVGNTMIDCHVQATGNPCPSVVPANATWPTGGYMVEASAGTSFDTSTARPVGSPVSSSNPFAYLDSTTGRLYIPAALWGEKHAGLLCADLTTETSCGYTDIYAPDSNVGTTSTVETSIASGIAGGVTIGTHFFVVGEYGHVYCVDMSGGAPQSCAGTGQPFNSAAPFATDPPTEPMLGGSAAEVRSFDGRHLFVAYGEGQGGASLQINLHLGCIDAGTPAALTPCAGFTAPTVGTTSFSVNEMLPLLDSSGAQTGICIALPKAGATLDGKCYDMAGNSVANPYPTSATLGYPSAGQIWGWNGQGAPAVIGTKVYYTVVLSGSPVNELYACHDFAGASGNLCSGFSPTPMPGVGGTAPVRAYTLTAAPATPNCIFEVGDAGLIDVLSASTGQNAYTGGNVNGCGGGRTSGTVSVTPSAFYCDGASGHTTTYNQLSLVGIPSGVTFSGTLKITDQTGTVLVSRTVSQSDFPIDLSSISTVTATTLNAVLSITVDSTSAWGQATPSLQVTFNGDAPQVCFKVTVPDNCGQTLGTTLNNSADLTVNGTAAATANYSFAQYSANTTCPVPGISLLKTAAEQSVSSTGTVIHYTFHVRNTGNTTLTNLTVVDQQALPAGAASAVDCKGVTTLAAGASTDCVATYTVTQADLDNGSINDTGTATGTPPSGPNVSATSSATVPVISGPAITLSKTPSPASVSAAGQTITYTFHLMNTGNVTLHNITVTDQQTLPAGALTSPVNCHGVTTLAPGASANCDATYTVTQADINHGAIDDTANATGTPPTGQPVTASATAHVPVAQRPAITILKTAAETSVSSTGTVIHYTFHVQNTGNVTLTNVTVTDQQAFPAGSLTSGVTCNGVTTLAPGAFVDCVATYTVTQVDLDNGSVSDTGTAVGTPPTGPTVQAQSSASVPAQAGPGLSVTKTADRTSYSAVGQLITYTITVKNTGNVTLHNLTVTDLQAFPAGALTTGVNCQGVTTLAPNASVNCTATYTVTQADLDHGSIADTATATAAPPSGSNVTGQATLTVPGSGQPAITILKTAAEQSVNAVGDVIHYTFHVQNTGTVTLHNLTVTDAQALPAGALTTGVTCNGVTTLAPGAFVDCVATYTVTQADLDNGSVNDMGTATATPPSGSNVQATSSASVPVTSRPGLLVTKTADTTSYSSVGQVITYTITVKNTGNVTVHNLTVTDAQTLPAGALTSGVNCNGVTTLAPNASATCTATYTVTQADLDHGSIADTAMATATPPTGSNVTGQASLSIPGTQRPGIGLLKTAAEQSVSAVGNVIHYTFHVQNTGNVTLHNLTVTDAQAPPAGALTTGVDCKGVTTLAPLASTDCVATYTVTQADLDNGNVSDTGTATGTPPTGSPVTAQSSASVPVSSGPGITVTKKADKASYSAVGQVITYTITVKNAGNVTLHNLSVTDQQALPAGALTSGVNCNGITTLAPGASVDCTATYTVTQADLDHGSITDTANATAAPPSGANVTGQATLTVPGVSRPAITLLKTAAEPSVSAVGDVIHYTFRATNSGNVTLHNLVVTDQQALPAGALTSGVNCQGTTTLAPGAFVDCVATYTVTLADLDNGSVNDTGTATATPPTGSDVTATSSASVPVNQRPGITITKTADVSSVAAAGTLITYTFHVKNTGNVTLSSLAVTDVQTPPAGALTSPVDCKGVTSLVPGATTDCTATYTVSLADMNHGSVDDTATATAQPPSGPAVSAKATLSVPAVAGPAISVLKKADKTTVSAVGDVISYTITVTNIGNVTLNDVTVADAQAAPAGALTDPVDCKGVTTLDPGQSVDCTATYTVTQDDLDHGAIDDTATGSGTPPSGAPVLARSSAHVAVTELPAITVTKTADVPSVAKVGDVITYTFHVANTGNVTLSNVGVTDVQAAPAGALTTAVDCKGITTLAPRAFVDCTATYTVTQDDLDHGAVDDLATASGVSPGGTGVSAQSSADVPATQSPSVTLSKSPSPGTVKNAGDVVTYTFTVTNTGNVTLHGIAVTDTQQAPAGKLISGPTCPVTTLAPGAHVDCTATYRVTQADIDHAQIVDHAAVSADPPTGDPVTAQADATVHVIQVEAQPPIHNDSGGLSTTGVAAAAQIAVGLAVFALGVLLLLAGARRRRS